MKDLSILPLVAWVFLTVICVAVILIGLNAVLKKTVWNKNKRRNIISGTIIIVAVWIAVLSILSIQNFFADFSILPPRPALAMLIPLPIIFIVAFSEKGTELLRLVPAHWLVYMQSFRIAVELLLLMAFIKGKIPVQMTFEGLNFDILTGILALPVGYILGKAKRYAPSLAIAFNIIGILLLANILVIAILSMPTPFRYFMNEPANTLVAQFPFILLPGVLVPIAYSTHIFSLRQLLIMKNSHQLSVPI
jgi:hypothetical protein